VDPQPPERQEHSPSSRSRTAKRFDVRYDPAKGGHKGKSEWPNAKRSSTLAEFPYGEIPGGCSIERTTSPPPSRPYRTAFRPGVARQGVGVAAGRERASGSDGDRPAH